MTRGWQIMITLKRLSRCKLLVLILSTMLLWQPADGRCKSAKVHRSLRHDAKLVLARANPYLKAYRDLDLDQIVPFVEPRPSDTARLYVKNRLEMGEGRNLHHGVSIYCVEAMRPATDGFHSIISGKAFYLSASSLPEEFFFYVSIEAKQPFFTHLMFSRSDTFHLSGAKPIPQ
jgi:hypothetical protein